MKKIVRSFNEEYRKIPRTNAQTDLSKYYAALDQQQEQETEYNSVSAPKPRRKLVWLWPVVALLVVLAIVLPVSLHFAFPPRQGEDELHYCDSAKIHYTPIASVQQFNLDYHCQVSLQTEQAETTCSLIESEEYDKVIGLMVDLYVYDELVSQANVLCYLGNERIDYNVFDIVEEESINGMVVKYGFEIADIDNYYYLIWSDDSITYYATVTVYEQTDVATVLQHIYPLR